MKVGEKITLILPRAGFRVVSVEVGAMNENSLATPYGRVPRDEEGIIWARGWIAREDIDALEAAARLAYSK